MCLLDWMGWELLWVHYDNDNWQFRASNFGIYDSDISNKELQVNEQWTALLDFAMVFKGEKNISDNIFFLPGMESNSHTVTNISWKKYIFQRK